MYLKERRQRFLNVFKGKQILLFLSVLYNLIENGRSFQFASPLIVVE